ncbi:hypothetical protein [Xanthobacter sediminis]
MTLIARSLLIVAAVTMTGAVARAQQTADDIKWITQCVDDNKDEGQASPVVLAYCTCMNGKMSSNETRSVTQWEKANPRAMEACSAEAGWKGK